MTEDKPVYTPSNDPTPMESSGFPRAVVPLRPITAADERYHLEFEPDTDTYILFERDGEVDAGVVESLRFQDGVIPEVGINGFTNEILIQILIHRLQRFQSGRHACAENANAIQALHRAHEMLEERTRRRVAEGLYGTHTPSP